VDELRNGELDAAYERFARAAPLYEQCGDALVKAQRNRVLASIHIMNRNWNDAEKMLHAALGGYFDFGYGYDVVRILLDLGSVYLAQKRPPEFNRALRRLHAFTRGREGHEFLLEQLLRFQHVVGDSTAAELSKIIADLEAARVKHAAN
ncbi:MAG: hypothetical protein GY838_17480, partial [bacterium]|nr:hypothetical protein [bacterium]